MQRFALVFVGVLLVGVPAVGASPAFAGQKDWAVNGVPLAPGQEVAVKFASTSPLELTVPDRGIQITCASWKGKGTLEGGVRGTGKLVNPKLAKCTEPGAAGPVRVKIHLEPITLETDEEEPVGAEPTIEFGLLGKCFRKGHTEEVIAGILDSFGPDPGDGNAIDFPDPSLPATTLTIGGSPAQLAGKAAFKLPKHAMLSQVEL
jgi:hypothetical protein